MKEKWRGNRGTVRSGKNETLLWLAEINGSQIQTHCKSIHLIAQRGETRI